MCWHLSEGRTHTLHRPLHVHSVDAGRLPPGRETRPAPPTACARRGCPPPPFGPAGACAYGVETPRGATVEMADAAAAR